MMSTETEKNEEKMDTTSDKKSVSEEEGGAKGEGEETKDGYVFVLHNERVVTISS